VTRRQAEKEALRRGRLAREKAERRTAARRRRLRHVGGGAALVAAVAAVVALAAGGHQPRSQGTPAGARLLASPRGEAAGRTVDGIRCQAEEQVLFHIHAHLAVYVNGRQRLLPEGIGIAPPRQLQQTRDGPFVVAGSCFYWLHTHARDGIVHIESPVRRSYTLGEFFDVWNQPLSRARVGPAAGRVIAYVDGRRFTGDPRSIPLEAHEVIQLDVGDPLVRPAPFRFPTGL
jgi:hypothetical protein